MSDGGPDDRRVDGSVLIVADGRNHHERSPRERVDVRSVALGQSLADAAVEHAVLGRGDTVRECGFALRQPFPIRLGVATDAEHHSVRLAERRVPMEQLRTVEGVVAHLELVHRVQRLRGVVDAQLEVSHSRGRHPPA